MLPVLISMTAGMAAGFLLRRRTRIFRFLDPATGWVIRLLLLLLGWGIGRDRALVSRIPDLGFKGLVIALAGIAGSVLAARLFIGRPSVDEDEAEPGQVGPAVTPRAALVGSLVTVLVFFLGVGAGLAGSGLPEPGFDPATPVLYLLMFLVGVGAGADPTALVMIRRHGLRLLLLPLGVITGTAAGTLVLALAWPALPIRETLAVGAGYGYYSLSSLVIRELSGGDWAAVALLSNISREIITLLTSPLLVRLGGPAAPAASGGATSMDTTLAATVHSSGRAWAVPALFSGVVLTILVPFLVTLILSV